MKKVVLGLALMGFAVPSAAHAGDRYESRSHDRARVGISINLGSGHRHHHHHRAPVVRHRPVIVDAHRDVVVHDEYGDHVVVREHRPRVYDYHDVYVPRRGHH